MRAERHLDDGVHHEAGQQRQVGIAAQHVGVDDLLDRHDHLARGLGHDPCIGPTDRGVGGDVARPIASMRVHQRHVGNQGAAGHDLGTTERVIDQLQVLGVDPDQVGADQASDRQEGQVAGAGAQAIDQRQFGEFLDPDRCGLDRPCGTAGTTRTAPSTPRHR